MAEIIGTETLTQKQSIARVELFTDARLTPDQWALTVHFEDGFYNEADELVGETQFGTRRVVRAFGAIKDTSISAAGATVTVAQLAALIQAACYQFRTEDIAAEQTPIAPEA